MSPSVRPVDESVEHRRTVSRMSAPAPVRTREKVANQRPARQRPGPTARVDVNVK